MKGWPKQLPLTPEIERAVAFYSCTDPDFYQRYGRHVDAELLSELGADETINMRAPCRVAMLAAHGVAARRGNGAGPSCAAEAVQWLCSRRFEGRATQEEEEAVRRLLDAAEHDRQRPSLEAVARDLSHELTIHFKAQLALDAINGQLDRVREWLGKIEGLSTNGAAGPEVETLVQVVGDVEPQRIEWLAPGWIAYGKVANCIGPPGAGKSLFAIEAARAVTTGEGFLGGRPREPARVMVVGDEDDIADTFLPRLLAAGADADAVLTHKIKSNDELRLMEICPREIASLERDVAKWNVRLVIFDPLADVMPAKVDEKGQKAVRVAMALQRGMAERTSAAVLNIMHLNKGTADGRALYRAMGSVAFQAVARSVLVVDRHPAEKERRVLARAKCTSGPPVKSIEFDIAASYVGDEIPTQRIVWGSECDISADELVAPPEPPGEKSELGHAVDFLRRVLAGGPRLVDEVDAEAKADAITLPTLKRARRRLGVESRKRVGDGQFEIWLPTNSEKTVEAKGIKGGPLDPDPDDPDLSPSVREEDQDQDHRGEVESNGLDNSSPGSAAIRPPPPAPQETP